MNYEKITLGNGLRVIVVPMPSLESVTVTVWVRVGSRFEKKRVNGISHFLEHMVFKGSKRRPSAKEISEAVDAIGGEFNASTSKEWTNFYIKARKGAVDMAFDVLSDMVLNPLLKEEEIEREKGVIVSEIKMYEDTPLFKIPDVFENLIFKGSSLGWDIAGTPKTVKNIKRDDFVSYRNIHYYPENMLISVAGGVTVKKVLELTKKYFGGLAKTSKIPESPNFTFLQKKPQALVQNKKSDQTHLILGFRGDRYGNKRRYAEALLGAILGGGMSSRLFLEVRERRGLAYAVKTSSEHSFDSGYLATYAGVHTKKAGEAVKVILDQYYLLAEDKLPIFPKELKKAKEFVKGHLALSLEDTKEVGSFFATDELYIEKPETPEEVIKKIDKVDVGEIYEVAKTFFKPQKLNLAVLGPFKDKSKFNKLLH